MLRDSWRLFSRAVASSEPWNWLVFLALLMGLGVPLLLLSPPSRNFDYDPLLWDPEPFCEQPVEAPAIGLDQFNIYVSVDFVGQGLCGMLSKSSEIGGRYGSVRADWSLSHEVLSGRIFSGHFDLLQLRPEQAQETGGPIAEIYKRISYYPAYKVYLIARDGAPELTGNYLKSRSIGLLANTKSRSGYRVPMQVFRDLGLDPQQLRVEPIASHRSLREALGRGDVGVISSYWGDRDRKKYPDWNALEIGGVKEGMNWFLKQDVFQNRQERCAVINALKGLKDSSGNSYFKELRFLRDALEGCDDR